MQKQMKETWLNFIWGNSTLNGVYFEKTDMSLPINLNFNDGEYSDENYQMQFDLGLPLTTFYYSMVNSMLSQHKVGLKENKLKKINGLKTAAITSKASIIIDNSYKISGKSFNVLYDKQDNEFDNIVHHNKIKPIGSIGGDVCENKILVIDYPNQQLAILDSIPDEYQKLNYDDFVMENHLILLPFIINGKPMNFIFDSGSSMFPILTSKTFAKELLVNNLKTIKTFDIPAWGSSYSVNEVASTLKVSINNTTLKNHSLFYSDYIDKSELFLKKIGAVGFVGNKYFLESTLILDFKNLKMAVLNS